MSTATLGDMLTLTKPETDDRHTFEEALEKLVESVTDDELEAILAEGRAAVVSR